MANETKLLEHSKTQLQALHQIISGVKELCLVITIQQLFERKVNNRFTLIDPAACEDKIFCSSED